MEITYARARRKKPIAKWMEIAQDYNNGESAISIAQRLRHKNGKPYTASYIYWVIRNLEKLGLITVRRKVKPDAKPQKPATNP